MKTKLRETSIALNQKIFKYFKLVYREKRSFQFRFVFRGVGYAGYNSRESIGMK